MNLRRKKVLVLCLCFWSVILILASTFRVRSWQILTTSSDIVPDNFSSRRPEQSSAHRPVKDERAIELIRQWKDWRQIPANWDQKKKEDFFTRNCQDLIDAVRSKEKKAGD